jgi:hypothetical protein
LFLFAPTPVRNYHNTAYTKMQESAQAQRERYAALQRKLEQLEKIHADEKKQVRFHFSPWLGGHLTFG